MELRIKQEVINRQNRFLIVDEKDNIVNNANGYGFKTKKSAHKAIYYMNNKKQIEKRKEILKIYIKKIKALKNALSFMLLKFFIKGPGVGQKTFHSNLLNKQLKIIT